jgi:hypothetical protein
MALKEEDLAKILQRPGYRVAGDKAPPGKLTVGVHELKRQVAESKLEIRFAQQLAERGIQVEYGLQVASVSSSAPPLPSWAFRCVRNYLDAIPGKGYELDFAWTTVQFFVEVDGGAHRTKGRFKADTIKHAMLLLAGWRGFRVSGADVREGRAIEWTMEWLQRGPA